MPLRERAREAKDQLHRQAVVQVWQICNSNDVSWNDIRRRLSPLGSEDTSIEQAQEIARDLNERDGRVLAEMTGRLSALTPDLPDGVDENAWEMSARLMRVSNTLSALQMATLEVQFDALTQRRQVEANDLSTKWTLKYRPREEGLEWDDLVRGAFLDIPEKKFKKLERETYLLARRGFSADGEHTTSP